ncbi:hypothetical protein [Marinobacter similis]|uniref:hypothetical protein n=1 Tax=Marinobacter similis TaxID=1420916 RepID=UPI00191BF33C|nr:hypothetical protein [Marinobacter similis]
MKHSKCTSMPRTLVASLIAVCMLALAACKGDSGSDSRDQSQSPAPNKPPQSSKPDTPNAEALANRYSPANGCYTLAAANRYVTANEQNERYDATVETDQATPFYLRPTALLIPPDVRLSTKSGRLW